MLEHQLERHFNFVTLAILLQRIKDWDVNVANQAKIAKAIAGIANCIFIYNEFPFRGHVEVFEDFLSAALNWVSRFLRKISV